MPCGVMIRFMLSAIDSTVAFFANCAMIVIRLPSTGGCSMYDTAHLPSVSFSSLFSTAGSWFIMSLKNTLAQTSASLFFLCSSFSVCSFSLNE